MILPTLDRARSQPAVFAMAPQPPLQVIAKSPNAPGTAWSARSVVHPTPLYRIEGEPDRRGDGIYDRMHSVGAHEVLVENPRHDRHLWNASDDEIAHFLRLAAERILDLEARSRASSTSASSRTTARTPDRSSAIPRRRSPRPCSCRGVCSTNCAPAASTSSARSAASSATSCSRRSGRPSASSKLRGDYLALCPYAPRVPYETWILPRNHDASFERTGLNKPGLRTNLAALLRRTLQRVRSVTEDFHLVLHTSPSSLHPSKNLGYWKTIDDDYHWHIEILPVISSKARSYTFKEVYYSPVSSETAVKQLREAKIDG